MLKHVWSILCRKSIIDIDTNNITLSDVLERIIINVNQEENFKDKTLNYSLPIEFEVVSLWFNDLGNKDLKVETKIEIFSPQGKLVTTFSHIFEIPLGTQ